MLNIGNSNLTSSFKKGFLLVVFDLCEWFTEVKEDDDEEENDDGDDGSPFPPFPFFDWSLPFFPPKKSSPYFWFLDPSPAILSFLSW